MTASLPAPCPPPRRTRPGPLVGGLLWAVLLASALRAADGPPLGNPADHLSDPVTQLVFMAVLEGCLRDGVVNEDIDLILPRNPDTGGTRLEELFVWSCPLCMPVVDALRMYRERGRFLSDKAGRDRFGPGLTEGVRRRLREGPRAARAQVLEELVAGWVRRRFELMRLADDERLSWSAAIGARRAQGELLLKGLKAGDYGDDYRALYGAWPERCPVCEAVGQACGREAPPPAAR
jgi:hypothetical protein